jgi:hypothetical protein
MSGISKGAAVLLIVVNGFLKKADISVSVNNGA